MRPPTKKKLIVRPYHYIKTLVGYSLIHYQDTHEWFWFTGVFSIKIFGDGVIIMLLRSTSAPILNSWLLQHSSLEPDSQLQRRNRSLSLLSSKSIDMLHQALSEHRESVLKSSNNDDNNNKTLIPRRQRRSSLDETNYKKRDLDPSSAFLVERLFSSSELGEKVRGNDDRLETLVSGGGGGMGSSGGKICNGGGAGGSGVDGGGSEDATDVYYREMIELNPGNSLLTGNYAKFLKEVIS